LNSLGSVDVTEYGLALATTIAIYLKEKRSIGSKSLHLIDCLGAVMSMDVKSLLDNL